MDLTLTTLSQEFVVLQMRHLVFELIRARLLDVVSLEYGLLTDVEFVEIGLEVHHLSVLIFVVALL